MKSIYPPTAKLIFWILAAATVFSPVWVNAQVSINQIIPIKLVVVKRNDITTQQQIDIFYKAISRLSEVKAYAKVTQIIETEDVLQKNEFDRYWSRMFNWWDWAKQNHINQKGTIVFFLLPPVYRDGIGYGGGAAGAVCVTTRNSKRQFAYSIVRTRNSRGEDRVDNSITSTLHELLHAIGANHYESKPNVMRSYFTPGAQPILPITKRQVEYCRQGKGINGK